MSYKNNIKQRSKTIQGLRSFKDTLPRNVKKLIKRKGRIFSEILNNWKYIVGKDLFQICFPKSYKNSNKLGVSTLTVMFKRGKEVELEYSKKQIIDNLNKYFGYAVVERLKLISFESEKINYKKKIQEIEDVTNSKFMHKIIDIKNKKIKKSLIELNKLFNKNEKKNIF